MPKYKPLIVVRCTKIGLEILNLIDLITREYIVGFLFVLVYDCIYPL